MVRKSVPKGLNQSLKSNVLAYDIGGTKVLAGIVSPRGRVLDEIRVPIATALGKKAVLGQLAELGRSLLRNHKDVRRIGIASAGPLDPKSGTLLDPTNMLSPTDPQGSWGAVPLAREMKNRLGLPVHLENDAAAAMLAEHWLGKAKGYKNAMILTLGTGLGVGVIADGQLVRAGRNLHPEGGHLILRDGDLSAPCGCGNLGCAEAYLSGKNFSRRARSRFGNSALSAKDITDLSRNQDPRARAAFEEYANLMAAALCSYVVIYCPEIIILTGSFAAASAQFLPKTRERLKKLLERRRVGIDLYPKITTSSLKNRAGLLGGAYVALFPRGFR